MFYFPLAKREGTNYLIIGIKTSSWNFNGERSDLNEIFSIILIALVQKVFQLPMFLYSSYESYNEFSGIESEIYIRYLRITTKNNKDLEKDIVKLLPVFEQEAIFLLGKRIDVSKIDYSTDFADVDEEMKKINKIYGQMHLKSNGKNPKYVNMFFRRDPSWFYIHDRKLQYTLFKSRSLNRLLRYINVHKKCDFIEPDIVVNSNSETQPSVHINSNLIDAVSRYFQTSREKTITEMIPIENGSIHLINRSGVVLFLNNKNDIDTNRKLVSLISLNMMKLGSSNILSNRIIWLRNPEPEELQEIAYDIFQINQRTISIRAKGVSNDRDSGVDLILERETSIITSNTFLINTEKIAIQCKTSRKTIGKSQVRDIRDTIEHGNFDGYILFAYPNISSQLIDFLEKINNENNFKVEWFGKREIETYLLSLPSLSEKYAGLYQIS